MSAGVIRWGDRPILTLTNEAVWARFTWNDQHSAQVFTMGNAIEIQVRVQCRNPYNGDAEFEWLVERLDPAQADAGDPESGWVPLFQENPVLVAPRGNHNAWYFHDYNRLIPMNQPLVVFRVKARIFEGGSLSTGSGGSLGHWSAWDQREFVAHVGYIGDFALDYVPVTLLYCPPGLDMVNGLRQVSTYETRLSLGFTKTVGSIHQSTVEVKGGLKLSVGPVSLGGSASASNTTMEEQSIANGINNLVTVCYTWGTTLLADNQRVIGRNFFGPLGDIFVVLQNPWFTLYGTPEGVALEPSDRSGWLTDLIILPAHKLLRPGDDTIALAIPKAARRRLLELDPFITNLDDFFPDDKGLPLSHAANPGQNPSRGNPATETGVNRAARLARYSLDAGVELDIELSEGISVSDTRTNETVYYSEVADNRGGSAVLGFFADAATLGLSGSSSNAVFARVSYLRSNEAILGQVRTAFCKLVRNQNEFDLSDIEVWWDKQFSTFMFRKPPLCKPLLSKNGVLICHEALLAGVLFSVEDAMMANARVDLLTSKGLLIESNMTDGRGQFRFDNVAPGRYRIAAGGVEADVEVDDDLESPRMVSVELRRARRVVDLEHGALWELADALDGDLRLARRVQRELMTEERLTDEAFERALTRCKVSPKEFARRALVLFPQPRAGGQP